MTALKFIKSASPIAEEVEISDELGNIISVPSRGASDHREYKLVMKRLLETQNNPDLAYGIEVDIVAICLRYRLRKDDSVTDDEILSFEDGSPLNIFLVKSLFQFFAKELGIEGLGAQKSSLASMEDATPYIQEQTFKNQKGFKKTKEDSK